MGEYIINGGRQLSGEIILSGAKNAALPLIAASLLTRGTVIHNCPRLSDTFVSVDILREMGCSCYFTQNVLICEPYGLNNYKISEELCSKMRSSVTFLGALLGRYGYAEIYHPGGCVLGSRPIDIHLDALKDMGVDIREEGNRVICRGKPHGANITLRYPSVGATENIILAATLAKGVTRLKNCAREPEIAELASFLNGAGAHISGAGEHEIVITGADSLDRCEHTLMCDRIEAGTYLCIAAATAGELFIKGLNPCMTEPVIQVLRNCGCIIKTGRDMIYIDAPPRLYGEIELITAPYPGLPTDMQAQLSAMLCLAKGESHIRETVFEARNRHIPELKKMGAEIECRNGCDFSIRGVNRLIGCEVSAPDLRGGAALITAALAAEGTSKIKNACYIRRGYENLSEKLRAVGAEIDYRESITE